ncbi:MAG: DUF692 domain-containing protein [Oligoflexales bacterium]
MTNISCRAGVGLRPTHYPHLETHPSTIPNWFEAISENYMNSQGRPLEMLEFVRKDYNVALHGVSMSLASHDGLRKDYLLKLKSLVDRIEPFIVSDHLCWTGPKASNIHDLLPFPFTEESLQVVSRNVQMAQETLGRSMVIENVSSYLEYKSSAMTEWDFLIEVCKRTGAKMLVDVNNIYVSSQNHGYDPYKFLEAIPTELVAQIHLAGFTDMGDFLFDTHSSPVFSHVWNLFARLIQRNKDIPFMIEWDENIPEFPVLEEELSKAINIWNVHHDDLAQETTNEIR